MTDVKSILKERGDRYGSFQDHAQICQALKHGINYYLAKRDKTLSDDKQQALDVICDKIARIINGDSEYIDNWIDIAGYAQLIVNDLESKHKQPIKPKKK